MKFFTPVVRISFGLVSLMLSIILAANIFTDPLRQRDEEVFQQRRMLLENLAVQYSALAQNGQIEPLRAGVEALVERNAALILSAALRRSDGTRMAITSAHESSWQKPPGDHSTLAHAQVPIFQDNVRWGTLEVSFAEAERSGWLQKLRHSKEAHFIGIVLILGFALFFFFIRRILEYLDPSAVIPDRVKAAFDVIPAGIFLLDDRERIVLANNTFRNRMGGPERSAVGSKPSSLPWALDGNGSELPWLVTQHTGIAAHDVRMRLPRTDGTALHLLVSTSPVSDMNGKVRGVLVALDDVTELDRVNDNLRAAVRQLEISHIEIERKNADLQRLATRDPLTGCLNRRAFFEHLEPLFMNARARNASLCCVMADIDHFKRFNDTYGHAVGDQVIQVVARTLGRGLRSTDLLCRYGGEEFCIVMPDLDIDQAMAAAGRIRNEIEESAGRAIRTTQSIGITVSFGLSALTLGAEEPAELIDQADQALYVSKQAGRNRVTRFDEVASEAAEKPQHAKPRARTGSA